MSDQPTESDAGTHPEAPPPRAAKSLRHEMRTPINQILGFAELLEEDAREAGQDRVVEDLHKIQRAARVLTELVDRHVSPDAMATTAPASAPPAAIPAATAGMTTIIGPALEGGEPAPVAVLVVDDNEMNRDMLARRLAKQGYQVETAEDGYKALEALARSKFDLVLLDIMMPGLNGYQVLGKLRESRSMSELPVIMATAKDQGEDIVEALGLGANDYVTKPLDFAVVIARVKTQLALKRAMEEVRRLAQELEVRNQFIRRTFGRYLSDDVVAGLLETPDGLALGGEKRTVTLLMSDLRGFSAVSERLTPEQVVLLLNRYLGAMAEVITQHRGTIDEFIGDAVLALFGAPVTAADDALRAVACAVDMQLRMSTVNEENRRDGLPDLQMGIAVNTGEVIVGNIGSETRAKYGVVGSPVNLTARIESCTLGGQVFISEATLAAVGALVEVGARMTMDVKGFSEPIAFYEVRRVGDPYGLVLPERRGALVRLAAPVTLRFSVLEGKHVSDLGREGRLVRLGASEAEISSDYHPQPLTNLRVRLHGDRGEIPADLYVKVLEGAAEAAAIRVGFTSVPPEVEVFLRSLRPTS